MYHAVYPPFMIVAPLAFVGLWCWWTGVKGLRKLTLATVAAAAAWALCHHFWGPSPLVTQLFALAGFFGLFFGLGLPLIQRAFRALPPPGPRGASLKPRRLQLFPGAFVWPYVAWGALTVVMFVAGRAGNLAWLGPVLGLVCLLVLKPCLRLSVKEPEPLGGADPEELARRYAAFRRRRVLGMYWLSVGIALLVTSSWGVLAGIRYGGAFLGPVLGIFGALFGTWADAQRYLLRRQLSGRAPPA